MYSTEKKTIRTYSLAKDLTNVDLTDFNKVISMTWWKYWTQMNEYNKYVYIINPKEAPSR